jgi:hypothetical protein
MPARGYKVTDADGWSASDGVGLAVRDEPYRLAAGELPILGERGFHFCPNAVDCLGELGVADASTMRLFAVEAVDTAYASVASTVYVTAALRVVGEVESIADRYRLLTGVSTTYFPDERQAVPSREAHYVAGRLHGDGDRPTVFVWHPRRLDPVRYEYHRDGLLQNPQPGAAAVTMRSDVTGRVVFEGFYENGLLGRADGDAQPVEIWYHNETGTVVRRRWRDGTLT